MWRTHVRTVPEFSFCIEKTDVPRQLHNQLRLDQTVASVGYPKSCSHVTSHSDEDENIAKRDGPHIIYSRDVRKFGQKFYRIA